MVSTNLRRFSSLFASSRRPLMEPRTLATESLELMLFNRLKVESRTEKKELYSPATTVSQGGRLIVFLFIFIFILVELTASGARVMCVLGKFSQCVSAGETVSVSHCQIYHHGEMHFTHVVRQCGTHPIPDLRDVAWFWVG